MKLPQGRECGGEETDLEDRLHGNGERMSSRGGGGGWICEWKPGIEFLKNDERLGDTE